MAEEASADSASLARVLGETGQEAEKTGDSGEEPEEPVDDASPEEEQGQREDQGDSDDDLPEKYKGKTARQIAEMHQHAEEKLGEQSNTVGELKEQIAELRGQMDVLSSQGDGEVEDDRDELDRIIDDAIEDAEDSVDPTADPETFKRRVLEDVRDVVQSQVESIKEELIEPIQQDQHQVRLKNQIASYAAEREEFVDHYSTMMDLVNEKPHFEAALSSAESTAEVHDVLDDILARAKLEEGSGFDSQRTQNNNRGENKGSETNGKAPQTEPTKSSEVEEIEDRIGKAILGGRSL